MTNTAVQSIAAQIYYPLGFAESIFAQACLLARTMGLHQVHSLTDDVSAEEAQERFKVLRSLYLRDKSLLISRGSNCWLPSFDCGLSSELDESSPTDSKFAAWIQLAGLQDKIYRLLHSQRRSSAQYKRTLLHLEQDLDHWANANEAFSSSYAGIHDVRLQLEFLAARICILRKSHEPGHVRRALSDSRASCLLVVISYGKHEPSMIGQLDDLLLSQTSAKILGRGTSGRSSTSGNASLPESTRQDTSEYAPLRFHNLLETFPIPAFFLLAMNTIRPSSVYDEFKTKDDLNLLKRTCACFKELDARVQANNHTRRVGQAFASFLQVIDLMKTSGQFQLSRFDIQQSTDAHDEPSGVFPFGEQHRHSDFRNPPSRSASLMPPVSRESFSNTNISAPTPDSPSAGASPGLLTPVDLYYQPYDPLQPNSFPYQIMRPPSLAHQQMSEPDMSRGYDADTMLSSEFLTKNPSLFFDVTRLNELQYF